MPTEPPPPAPIIYNAPIIKAVTVNDCFREVSSTDSPEGAVQYWHDHIATCDWFHPEKEHLVVLHLNSRNKIKSSHLVACGLLDQILAHARETFREAIVAGAKSVILMHNHPSGVTTASEADIRCTRDLVRAGQLLRIEVTDHVIVAPTTRGGFTSLRQMGVVPNPTNL